MSTPSRPPCRKRAARFTSPPLRRLPEPVRPGDSGQQGRRCRDGLALRTGFQLVVVLGGKATARAHVVLPPHVPRYAKRLAKARDAQGRLVAFAHPTSS